MPEHIIAALAAASNDPSPSLLESALAWAAAGFAVFPCHTIDPTGRCSCKHPDCTGNDRGKHPRTLHGCLDATRDPAQIKTWWGRWPDSNIGIATGAPSGDVWVLDVDVRKGGFESLAKIEHEAGKPASTLMITTGSGGAHLYFTAPSGAEIRNKVDLRPGIDVRGTGGYVIAPPSRHWCGGIYGYDPGSAELGPRTAIAKASPQLLALVRGSRSAPTIGEGAECIGEGGRDNTLFEAACALTRGGLSTTAVAEALRVVADQACERPTDFPDRVLKKIAGSARKAVDASVARAAARAAVEAPPAPVAADDRDTQRQAVGATADDPDAGEPLTLTADKQNILMNEKRTDAGNAIRFLALFPNAFRFLPGKKEGGRWLSWDGSCWVDDETGGVERAMLRVARATLAVAGRDEELAKEAIKLQNVWRLRNAVTALRWQRLPTEAAAGWPLNRQTVTVKRSWFDRDPYLLNCPNGVLDLRTGELRKHHPSDLLRRRVGMAYDPHAKAPTWEAFLRSILLTGPSGGTDEDLMAYMQRALGYALCGDTREQVMFVLFGHGANGKSTLIETLSRVLGDYAHGMSFESFLDDPGRHGGGDVARSDLAQLQGPRFVHAVESKAEGRLDEASVKAITGGDTIRVRSIYEVPFAFRPQFTLFLGTNHKPKVRGTDHAIWRRLKLVPFDATFATSVEQERAGLPPADLSLPAKLLAEGSGILKWLVDGCLMWQQRGLGSCRRIDGATSSYRIAEDPLYDWMAETCTKDPDAATPAQALYDSYVGWCAARAQDPITGTDFGIRLENQGYMKKRNAKGILRRGLALRAHDPQPGQSE